MTFLRCAVFVVVAEMKKIKIKTGSSHTQWMACCFGWLSKFGKICIKGKRVKRRKSF